MLRLKRTHTPGSMVKLYPGTGDGHQTDPLKIQELLRLKKELEQAGFKVADANDEDPHNCVFLVELTEESKAIIHRSSLNVDDGI